MFDADRREKMRERFFSSDLRELASPEARRFVPRRGMSHAEKNIHDINAAWGRCGKALG